MIDKEDSLGNRMKNFEGVSRSRLMPKVPVVVRVDGKAFHSFTANMQKPVDKRLVACMEATALALCEQVEGTRIAYVQSDEISLILMDDQTINTQAWFDYNLQKVVSVTASIATAAFNAAFSVNYTEAFKLTELSSYALFDSRAFNLPKYEIENYLIWRQNDAVRNSINSLAQAHFSHAYLQGVSQNQAQELLFSEKGINWNDLPIKRKRGVCVVREKYVHNNPNGERVERSKWAVDDYIPSFTQDRNYIEKKIARDE